MDFIHYLISDIHDICTYHSSTVKLVQLMPKNASLNLNAHFNLTSMPSNVDFAANCCSFDLAPPCSEAQ